MSSVSQAISIGNNKSFRLMLNLRKTPSKSAATSIPIFHNRSKEYDEADVANNFLALTK